MTPKFVNLPKYFEKDIKELNFYKYFRSPKRYLIYAVCSIVFTLIWAVFESDTDYILILFMPFVFFASIMFCHYCGYRSNIKRDVLEMHEKIIDNPDEVYYNIYDDKIVLLCNGEEQATVEFSQIKRIKQSKNFLFFVASDNHVYILNKIMFSVGTTEEFFKFLRSKGFKIKQK